jgi:hypothetical protein
MPRVDYVSLAARARFPRRNHENSGTPRIQPRTQTGFVVSHSVVHSPKWASCRRSIPGKQRTGTDIPPARAKNTGETSWKRYGMWEKPNGWFTTLCERQVHVRAPRTKCDKTDHATLSIAFLGTSTPAPEH